MMQEPQKKFKSSPKKYQPRGLTILYEDHDLLVVDKRGGLLTVSTDKIKDNTAFYLLNSYVKKGNQKSKKRVYIVHRLDRDTSGVLVFAKNDSARQYLQSEWQTFDKKYHAIVHGVVPVKEGVITSYLAQNSAHKMYSVNDSAKGKFAKTGYRVLQESGPFSLLEIDLLTGRKNQIRAHLAEHGFPVAGDNKYGEKDKGVKRLMLHAVSITITHPKTKEAMTFSAKVPSHFKTLVKGSG
jgi:RluA family pseudouridine synthase